MIILNNSEMMNTRNRLVKVFGSLIILLLASTIGLAGPYGFDLHNVLSPKAAGMAGTSIAGDANGPVEAIYGNPANLKDLAGTQSTMGATLYIPDAHAEHDGSVTGTPYDTTSNTQPYTVPQIAVSQDLSGLDIPLTIGLGMSASSGIGVSYRDNPGTLGAGAEFIALAINTAAAYELSDRLDIGAALTISYATLEAGVLGSSAQTHDYGFRGTLGFDYHLNDKADIGVYYQTKHRHRFKDMLRLGNGDQGSTGSLATNVTDIDNRSLEMEQPRNYALGISYQLNERLRLASDFIYKEWDSAEFWRKFYDDQVVFSFGAEYQSTENLLLRLGYGWSSDPTDEIDRAYDLEGFNALCTGVGGACFNLNNPAVWNWLQAMETPVIYQHRLTGGMTYDRFLGVPFLSVDAHVGYQFKDQRTYQESNTILNVRSYHGGLALNWKF